MIGLLFTAARDKNVAAIKKLDELGRVAGAAEALEERARPRVEPKLGKKEEQQKAAERPGASSLTRQRLCLG